MQLIIIFSFLWYKNYSLQAQFLTRLITARNFKALIFFHLRSKLHLVIKSDAMKLVSLCRGAIVEWWNGVMVKHADHNAGVLSSIPPCVTIEMPLVRKAMGSHLIKSTSLEKNSEPCLWFLLRSKSSILWDIMNILFCEEGNGNPPHRIYFPRKKLRALYLVSATLEIESSMRRSCEM